MLIQENSADSDPLSSSASLAALCLTPLLGGALPDKRQEREFAASGDWEHIVAVGRRTGLHREQNLGDPRCVESQRAVHGGDPPSQSQVGASGLREALPEAAYTVDGRASDVVLRRKKECHSLCGIRPCGATC